MSCPRNGNLPSDMSNTAYFHSRHSTCYTFHGPKQLLSQAGLLRAIFVPLDNEDLNIAYNATGEQENWR